VDVIIPINLVCVLFGPAIPTSSFTCTIQDELEKNIIPQIPLFDLLNKFNGVTEKVSVKHIS
jgi:hypothetical protein